MPEYAKASGLPDAGSAGYRRAVDGEKLYPARYAGVNVDAEAQKYYQRFYRVDWRANAGH